ncbi:MAG: sulfatase-like hydrolase/transferase [Flavobacteriaceae bacterium]|nr:sulfatase-like hydrolase/transferase [Flavobacteriaceae bacterium]
MSKNYFKKLPVAYLKTMLVLLLMFWLLSLFEVAAQAKTDKVILTTLQVVVFKLLHDAWTVFMIGIVFSPLYLILNVKGKKTGQTVFVITAFILVLVNISLVQYSLTTLLNLGADLLGYSFDDIFKTVSSQGAATPITDYIYFVVFVLLFFVVNYLVKHKIANKLSVLVVVIAILGAVPFRFLTSQFTQEKHQNKVYYLVADIVQYNIDKATINTYKVTDTNEYPILKRFQRNQDVLSGFFTIQPTQKPNIVVVILEGQGAEFVDGNTYSGFAPYIDSLINKSLYWENFVSTTGRTFGVVPSLLGSLPFGDTGFLEIPETPSHVSLFSILKQNGYTTSYYTGAQASFDRIINFLEYNDVDFVVDENMFEDSYVKTSGNSGGFSWGYPDNELFKKMLATIPAKKLPRFDVISTLTNHEPFNFPKRNIFETKVDSILNNSKTLKLTKAEVEAKKEVYAAQLYVDDAVRKFMTAYQERADYNNTIFIFTGDHRIIPIEQKDQLCRFHVPLFIYSPMLTGAHRFKGISSHWDIAPSLVSFLTNNYTIEVPEQQAWMGKGLDTSKKFRGERKIALMRYKGGLKDYIYNDYLLSGEDLYKINSNFSLNKLNDEALLKQVKDSFNEFKKINAYVAQNDKIYPPKKEKEPKVVISLSEEEQQEFDKLIKGKTYDEVFLTAREQAFAKKRKMARALCDYILRTLPNHADARILKGRTLSWDGEYQQAEKEFLSTIKRHPFYDDPYLALLDLYWWSSQDDKGVLLAKKGLKNKIKNAALSFKLAKAYKRLKQNKAAVKVTDSLLKLYPKNKDYIAFKKSLK